MPEVFNFIPIEGTFLQSILPSYRRSRNNPYISQPDFSIQKLNLSLKEQYVSINGQERDIFLTTSPLRIVVNRLANMYANGLWKHLDRNGEPIPIEKSLALQRLNSPNVFHNGKEMLYQHFVQRCVYGNIFEYQYRGSRLEEIPRAFWNMSPSRVTVKRTGLIWTAETIEEMIAGYTFKYHGAKPDMQIDTSDIIQYSMPDSDDPLMSDSPLIGVRMEISNIRAAMGFRNVILTKKGAIGAWSSAAKDTTGSISLRPEEEEKLIREAQRMYGINDEQNAFMISSKELKWTSAVFPTKDLMLFEEIDADKRAIIDLFGANDNMFSRPASGKGDTFTNVEAGEKICYQDTISKVAAAVAEKRTKRWGLAKKGETLTLTYDHLPVMQQDEKKKAEVVQIKSTAYERLLLNGFTKEEASVAVGLEEPANGRPKEVVPAGKNK